MGKIIKEISKQEIIEEIIRFANENKLSVVTLNDFKKYSKISTWHFWKTFNSWNEAVELAGFKPNITKKKKTNDELWEELLRVCTELNAIPNRMEFERNANYSSYVYTKKRWHTWENVLINFKDWLTKKDSSSKFIKLISDIEKPKKVKNKEIENTNGFVWQSNKDIIYGPPINFRGLRHEPINEQGVVFLFGKISEELGFSIEAIRTEYPDCNGKRLVNKNKNLWESVSIEFEYKSSNFLEHGHDLEKCDVIICWVHDWLGCPLEVIELKEIVKKLMK